MRLPQVDLTGARFEQVRFGGATFHDVDLSGVRFRAAWVRDAVIAGELESLRIHDIDVIPLVEAELDRRHPNLGADAGQLGEFGPKNGPKTTSWSCRPPELECSHPAGSASQVHLARSGTANGPKGPDASNSNWGPYAGQLGCRRGPTR